MTAATKTRTAQDDTDVLNGVRTKATKKAPVKAKAQKPAAAPKPDGDANVTDAAKAVEQEASGVQVPDSPGDLEAKEIQRELIHLRDNTKFTRKMLATAAGLTDAKLWRVENKGRIFEGELAGLRAMLDRIKSGDLVEPEPGSSGASAPTVKKADLLKLIESGRDADDEQRAVIFGQLIDMLTPVDLSR